MQLLPGVECYVRSLWHENVCNFSDISFPASNRKLTSEEMAFIEKAAQTTTNKFSALPETLSDVEEIEDFFRRCILDECHENGYIPRNSVEKMPEKQVIWLGDLMSKFLG